MAGQRMLQLRLNWGPVSAFHQSSSLTAALQDRKSCREVPGLVWGLSEGEGCELL